MPKRVSDESRLKGLRGQWCVAKNRRGKRVLFKIVRAGAHQVFLARLRNGRSVGKFKHDDCIVMQGSLHELPHPILFQAIRNLACINLHCLNLTAWNPPAARVLRAWRESKFTPRTQRAHLGDLSRDTIVKIATYVAVECRYETEDISNNKTEDVAGTERERELSYVERFPIPIPMWVSSHEPSRKWGSARDKARKEEIEERTEHWTGE